MKSLESRLAEKIIELGKVRDREDADNRRELLESESGLLVAWELLYIFDPSLKEMDHLDEKVDVEKVR